MLPRKIVLACGQRKPDGEWHCVDKIDTEICDQVLDLDDDSWNLPSNYFTSARARDIYEHLDNPVNFMEEVYRILEDGGELYIRSPHISSQNWTDPTHKRLVGYESMKLYFTDDGKYSYYSDCTFEVITARIIFGRTLPYNMLIEPLVNINNLTKSLYENTFLSRLFPASNVEFVLKAVKG